MSKHTPGPWRIKGEMTRRTLKGANGKSIVVVERWTKEEDACLIAAAPDLLAALKLVEPYVSLDHLGQVQAAIAKAEGV